MSVGKLSVCLCMMTVSVVAFAQIPSGYYDEATGLTGTVLKQTLHDLIDNHNVVKYGDLVGYFPTTDIKSDGSVWDMYSDCPGLTPAYVYYYNNKDECGNYKKEGDCYNKEHSFPKSWFGGKVTPMYTDLFHIYPTDGKVNGYRSNYPFGETDSPTITSTNGSKLGNSSVTGYDGVVFEPVDEYKGDFARTYFYMATRYFGEDGNWPRQNDMTDGAEPKKWAMDMLLKWHANDAVSKKEIDRNNAVYQIQGNRNPFIDHPEYVAYIWGNVAYKEDIAGNFKVELWPNPVVDILYFGNVHLSGDCRISIFDIMGRKVYTDMFSSLPESIDLSMLYSGVYIIKISGNSYAVTRKIVVIR